MLRKAGLDIYGIEGVEIQPRLPFATPVTLVSQIFAQSGEWQTVKEFFAGRIVGTAADSEGDAYHDAFIQTILPDEPQPEGQPYASLHPLSFDLMPRVHIAENGGELAVRFAFVEREEPAVPIS